MHVTQLQIDCICVTDDLFRPQLFLTVQTITLFHVFDVLLIVFCKNCKVYTFISTLALAVQTILTNDLPCIVFLASPDALEVIVVSYSLTHLLTYLLSDR